MESVRKLYIRSLFKKLQTLLLFLPDQTLIKGNNKNADNGYAFFYYRGLLSVKFANSRKAYYNAVNQNSKDSNMVLSALLFDMVQNNVSGEHCEWTLYDTWDRSFTGVYSRLYPEGALECAVDMLLQNKLPDNLMRTDKPIEEITDLIRQQFESIDEWFNVNKGLKQNDPTAPLIRTRGMRRMLGDPVYADDYDEDEDYLEEDDFPEEETITLTTDDNGNVTQPTTLDTMYRSLTMNPPTVAGLNRIETVRNRTGDPVYTWDGPNIEEVRQI